MSGRWPTEQAAWEARQKAPSIDKAPDSPISKEWKPLYDAMVRKSQERGGTFLTASEYQCISLIEIVSRLEAEKQDAYERKATMLVGFDKWWQEDGKMIDPDTEDVPWFDKRKALSELAFEAGVKCGMARSANYTANDAVKPSSVEFANGRTVKIREMCSPDSAPYLEIGKRESKPTAAKQGDAS